MLNQVSLVEKVARAIADVREAEAPEKPAKWRDFHDEAYAAIAAMRVPTQTMLEVAGEGMIDYSDINHEWRIMVDAALREKESHTPTK